MTRQYRIPGTINNKEVKVWQVLETKTSKQKIFTCALENSQNWKSFRTLRLEDFLLMNFPNIRLSSAYWHFIQAWDMPWILHSHILGWEFYYLHKTVKTWIFRPWLKSCYYSKCAIAATINETNQCASQNFLQ